MYLSDEQAQRYQKTLTSLLEYTDEHLRVTRKLPPGEDMLYCVERTALIARELWRNLDIVERFADDNPDGLTMSHLEMVRSWKDGIYCRCIVTGYDRRGNATVETEVGTFSVCGIVRGVTGFASTLPIAFKAALLPVDEHIVFGMPIGTLGRVGDGELSWMRERAVTLGISGVAVTAADLRARAPVYACLCAEDELRMLSSVASSCAEPAAGFHRGILAGKSLAERLALTEAHLKEQSFDLCDTDPDPAIEDAAISEAFDAACACALLYGIISLVDAYTQYVAVSASPLAREDYEQAVVNAEHLPQSAYGFWRHGGVTYLVALALTEAGAYDAALSSLIRRQADKLVQRGIEVIDARDVALALDDADREELARTAQVEYERLQGVCVQLLLCQAGRERRPLEFDMVEQGIYRYLLQTDTLIALRDFIDRHVPDGQDDYVFADSVTTSIVALFFTLGTTVEMAYDLLASYDLMRCEGGEWSDTLGRMVVNVYNSMPRWSCAGWSLRQQSEWLTGKKMFYAADGSLMRVGSDDPCPCGSGERYRCCCGRIV